MINKEVIEIKDLGTVHPMTLLGKDIEEELKQLGRITHSVYKDSILYHLVLDLKDYYNKENYLISFVKGLYSYGYDQDLWEIAVIRIKKNQRRIKGIKGNLTDKEVLEYTKDVYSQLKSDQSYFDNLPLEYYE